MTTVARLTADLSINTSKFEAGLISAGRALKNNQKILNNFSRESKTGFAAVSIAAKSMVATYALMSGAAIAAGVALATLTSRQIKHASGIKDAADRLQIGTTALQKYQFAAMQVGTSAEELETGISKLNAKIADGSLHYKDATDGLNSIADAVMNAKTGEEKLAIVNDAFGAKLGSKMLPMLLNGADGLRKLGDEAERTGNVIGAGTIEATDKLGDSLDSLFATISNNFSQGFLDELTSQSGNLRDIYGDPKFQDGMKNIGVAIGDIAAAGLNAAAKLGEVLGKLNELNNWSKEGGNQNLDDKVYQAAGNAITNPKMKAEYFKILERQKNKTAMAGSPAAQGSGEMLTNAPAGNFQKLGADIPKGKSTAYHHTGKTTQSLIDSTKAIFDGLKNETDQLKIQTSMYGQKESAILRARKNMEIQNKLTADGVTLTAKQKEQLTEYLTMLEQQTELQKQQEKYQNEIQDFTNVVSSSFEDAILNGGKLSNVFNGLLRDIEKMALKKSILEPLFGDGSAGSGGFLTSALGSIGSFIFGGAPSHATGQANVPYDMTARLHKGERVTTAQMNKGGNGDVILNVTNKTDAKITANKKNDGNGVRLDMMVDNAVAKNIGQRGSSTNKALDSFSSRTLIRR